MTDDPLTPSEVALVARIVAAIVRELRPKNGAPAPAAAPSQWLTIKQAAEYANVGVKMLYREAEAGRLRTRKVGGRRDHRLLAAWIDEWLTKTQT